MSTKAVKTPDGILVRLSEKLQLVMKIDIHKLKMLIDKYTATFYNGRNTNRVHFDKVNTYNEFTRNKMTIKVFFKLFRILNLASVKLGLVATTVDGLVYQVEEEVTFTTVTMMDEPKVINKELTIADGVLSKLKKKLCAAMGLKDAQLKALIDEYTVVSLEGNDSNRVGFDRINTFNELTKPKMTIKVFFKFLRIVKVKSIRIVVTAQTKYGKEFTVHEDVNFMTSTVKEATKDE